MPVGTILLLGAFAGLTIYLGLPLAFLKNTPQTLKVFLNMVATGVLIFLLYDVVGRASEPIETALGQARTQPTAFGPFALDTALFVLGLGLGSVGLVYFNRSVLGRLHIGSPAPQAQATTPEIPHEEAQRPSSGGGSPAVATLPRSKTITVAHSKGELSPYTLALLIATGIGLHNFSEGLAIGQSAMAGELQLALVLMIGFGLHNMTEGFGIAGPLTGQSVSWRFVFWMGLIGGGPTFLGTLIGTMFNSPPMFILFLALAAGAIIYVITELLGMAKRFKEPSIVMWGLLIGFLLGYATDLILTFSGA